MTEAPETAKTNTEAAKGEQQQVDPKVVANTLTAEVKPETQTPAVADAKKDPEGTKTPEIKLELKVPEGSLLDAGAVEKAVARAKELKLSPEQAQADLNRESEVVKTFVEGEKAKLAKEVGAWVEESKKDTEIGGEAFAANAEIAKRVVNRFGTDKLKTALNDTGLGNHPELIRLLVRAGRAMSEDQLVLPSGQPTEKRSQADVLYGSAETKEK